MSLGFKSKILIKSFIQLFRHVFLHCFLFHLLFFLQFFLHHILVFFQSWFFFSHKIHYFSTRSKKKVQTLFYFTVVRLYIPLYPKNEYIFSCVYISILHRLLICLINIIKINDRDELNDNNNYMKII